MPELYSGSHVAVVVGRGPVGLTAALALAGGGISTVLAGKPLARPDNRTTALLGGSVTALEMLGVWTLCAARAAPIKVMRIVDDTGRLWRAPEIKFQAGEIPVDGFGYKLRKPYLVECVEDRAPNPSR